MFLKAEFLVVLILTFSSMSYGARVEASSAKIRSNQNTVKSAFNTTMELSYFIPANLGDSRDEPTLLLAAAARYSHAKGRSFGFSTRYFHETVRAVKNDQVELYRGEAGLKDSQLFYTVDQLYSNQEAKLTLGYALGLTLPTSENSQNAGLNSGYWGNIVLSKSLGFVTLINLNQIGINDYRWDTWDLSGDQYNEEYFMLNSLVLAVPIVFFPGLSWNSTGAVYTAKNYANSTIRNYALSTSLKFKTEKNLAFVFLVGTQDQRSENNNLFLDDKSFVSFAVQLDI